LSLGKVKSIEISIAALAFAVLLLLPENILARIGAILALAYVLSRQFFNSENGVNGAENTLDANCLPDAVIISDLNGKLLSGNATAKTLFENFQSATTVPQLFQAWHNELNDRGPADEVVAAALAAPDFQFSETLHFVDGKAFERLTRVVPDTSERVWIIRDISHLQQAHHDSEMHTTMVEADAARTAELAEQLYHAKAELESNQAELTRLANTDSLTGLLNRRRFTALGEEAIQNSDTGNIWVIMMDIDHFKRINDTYGHAAGDVAIRNFANLTEEIVGEDGFVGRMGGEEFAAILENVEMDGAIKVAEVIRKATAALVTIHEAEKFRFTASLGVAQWSLGEITIEAALDRADQALYSAKTFGRNRVVGYETGRPT
jgi:diguanylate cyclase (GGDEF)-like protein